ncbi:MAG: cysteine desulfuration protein SufE [Robiginitomaculum sp.]|nr:MAG: cysteine desulfuration protein SufE [Robiginitomaculum sp.]
MTYPQNIQNMIDDFAFLEDWEDRYMHVIEMGKALAPLSEADHTPANKVNGCVSQVWLITDVHTAPEPTLHYRGDSDAHIVKGLVAIVINIFSGRTPKDIINTDAKAILDQLGLSEHLSMQRSNGLNAMIARIQQDARALLER